MEDDDDEQVKEEGSSFLIDWSASDIGKAHFNLAKFENKFEF